MTRMISPVQHEDRDRIVEVWEAAVRATHHFLSEDDIAMFRPLVRDTYLDLVQLFGMRAADGEITGFVGVADRKIEMLFVDPAYHGQGIGRALVEYACSALGANQVDVNEQNSAAVGFYERLGFTVHARSELDSMGKPYPLLNMRRDYDNGH